MARRAPPEASERREQHAPPDAVTLGLPLDDSPRAHDIGPARSRVSGQKNRAQVNARPEYERQHRREIDYAYERSEDDAVRPARAVLERDLVWQPQKAEDAPARVLPRLYVEVWPEHQPAEQHARRSRNAHREAAAQTPRRRERRRREHKGHKVVRLPRRHKPLRNTHP